MANGADNLDHASDIEQAFRDAAVKYARYVEPVPKDFDGDCYDCGGEIHEARLALGKFRCTPCQERKEKGGKLYGRKV